MNQSLSDHVPRWEQRTSPYPTVNSAVSEEEWVSDIRQLLLVRQIAPASYSYWKPAGQSPLWLATQLAVRGGDYRSSMPPRSAAREGRAR